jgi:hypothetical protein
VIDDMGMAFGSNLPASISGNIMLGSLALDGGPETLTSTAALRQYTPGPTYDGHFVAYDNATAQGDVTKFLAQVAMGQLPKIPE